jgi:hypothetical protein
MSQHGGLVLTLELALVSDHRELAQKQKQS